MTPSIKFEKNQLAQFELDLMIHEENGIFVAYIPALDLSTHGDSVKDATKAASEAAMIFIQELQKMDTLDQVLTELGWKKIADPKTDFPYLPPHVIHSSLHLKNLCHA